MEEKHNSPVKKWLPRLAPALVLCAAIAAVYWPAFTASLVNWDDDAYIVRNYLLHDFSFGGVARLFTRFYALNYQPVTLLSYMLEHQLAGHAPFIYHAVNIALHMANTLLVLALCGELLREKRAALLCALLFALHPMHVESVAWVAERKDVLYAFFYLAGLLAYLKAKKKDKFPAGALVFFALSLLSKSMAVTFPLAIVTLDWLKGRPIWKADKIPFFLLTIVFAWVTLRSQNRSAPLAPYQIWQGIQLSSHNMLFYPAKLFYPAHLSAFYPLPQQLTPFHFIAPFAALLVYGAAWYLAGKNRLAKAGILFFLLTIAPVLQFVPIGRTIAADRYIYIPMMGLALPLAAFLIQLHDHLTEKRWKYARMAFSGLLAVALFTLCAQARARCLVWHDSVSLWTDVLSSQPDNVIALTNRGLALKNTGQLAPAIADFNRALELDPRSAILYSNRSMLYASTGALGKALEDAEQALRLEPDNIQARINRGVIYFMENKAEEAERDFKYALERQPENTEARLNLEQCELLKGKNTDGKHSSPEGQIVPR